MLRKMGVTGSFMLLSLALSAFTPLQAEEGGIANYWWSIIIIVAFVLILFLILSVLFAYRDAPSEVEMNAQAEQEAADKAARRAAREADAAQAADMADAKVAEPEKAPDVATAAAEAAAPAVVAEAVAEPEPEPEPEPVVAAKPDDLKKIEGIGPKVSDLLVAAGITTFSALANSDQPTLQKVLDDAGSRYRIIDPTTWPAQAKMAAEGRWDDLKTLQDNLKGGRQIS